MNITKEQIREWLSSHGYKIHENTYLPTNEIVYAISGCINDLSHKIEAGAVLKAAMELDLYSVNFSDTGINVGDELADYASKLRAGK